MTSGAVVGDYLGNWRMYGSISGSAKVGADSTASSSADVKIKLSKRCHIL